MRRSQKAPLLEFDIEKGSVIGCVAEQVDFDLTPPVWSRHISGRRAPFRHSEGQWFVRDEKSLHGTFVNGHRIPALQFVPIRDGDTITLANAGFTFKIQ